MGQHLMPQLEQVIALIEQARSEGVRITADMYPYTATATGFDVAMPGWVQEGGIDKWVERLKDPATRARVLAEMRAPADASPGSVAASGPPHQPLIPGGKPERKRLVSGNTVCA